MATRRLSLREITNQVADVVCARADQGRNYGVILIPEGLVEHAYDLAELIRGERGVEWGGGWGWSGGE